MYRDGSVAGDWAALVARLDGSSAVRRWAESDADLTGLRSVDDVVAALRRGAEPGSSDRIVGALVRLAAMDGGRDDDALLLLLHLLSDWVLPLARSLADLAPDMLGAVVGELACQIRAYPWRRLNRAHAANLRWRTRRVVLAEYRPSLRGRGGCLEIPLEPDSREWADTALAGTVAGPGDGDDLDARDFLSFAVQRGVDAELVDFVAGVERLRAEEPATPDVQIAARFGLSLRTFYRRQSCGRAALRSLTGDYLTAVG